ncbi:CDC27 family protein [uncultured Phascolarctobacterium sp.]|uniref:tetratricopeptide repeat protein n=1 Tax=uncultured Phascolarctobacterium sp. TaxID=512296 RepID=UPI00261AAFBC|nr:CDC27 family protein [uncultured Phascolarctobacterium sp.]
MAKKYLFCYVSYMDLYDGIELEKNTPFGGGSFVAQEGKGMEEHNFTNYNGKCYGYVRNPGLFKLERLDAAASNSPCVHDVTIVWCAPRPKGDVVIVGWYEHATLFREGKYLFNGAGLGYESYYICQTNAEDAYLLAEKDRIFIVPRAAKSGKGKGFGQQNYWYADGEWARSEFVPKVEQFIATHKENTINLIPQHFLHDFYSKEPVNQTLEEVDKLNVVDYLPRVYRMYNTNPSANLALAIAGELKMYYQFDMAIEWCKKAVQLEGNQTDTLFLMAQMYLQLEEFDQALDCLERLKETGDYKLANNLANVYALASDVYWMSYKDDEAMKYLDMAITACTIAEETEHMKQVKENHLKELQNK